MVEPEGFSEWLRESPEAQSPEALARVAVGKRRIQAILDRETVAHQKTLEQKISEQGPDHLRVDPHLVGLALKDLQELRRLRRHTHQATGDKPWFSNLLTPEATVHGRLAKLAPLYAQVAGSAFGNLTGDALEVVVYKCLDEVHQANPRYIYQGYFKLDEPKNAQGRFNKVQPPKTIGNRTSTKEADFIQFGYDEGGLCIECKNYREWLYPHHGIIQDLITKADTLGLMPVLIHRRIHYTTRTNLLEPAGIIAHESYFQYYPSDKAPLAEEVRHKRSLGFTDVRATEEPDKRTRAFFLQTMPKLVPLMAKRWNANREQLVRYAQGEINLAQLYSEIGSPAGGKWRA